jgi:hypothetical protein
MEKFVNFQEWLDGVSPTLKGDVLWKMKVYQVAVFIGDLAWPDVTKLMHDRRTIGLSDQLYEAIGSISANLDPKGFLCQRKRQLNGGFLQSLALVCGKNL